MSLFILDHEIIFFSISETSRDKWKIDLWKMKLKRLRGFRESEKSSTRVSFSRRIFSTLTRSTFFSFTSLNSTFPFGSLSICANFFLSLSLSVLVWHNLRVREREKVWGRKNFTRVNLKSFSLPKDFLRWLWMREENFFYWRKLHWE